MKKIFWIFLFTVVILLHGTNAYSQESSQNKDNTQVEADITEQLGINDITNISKLLVLDSKHGNPHFYVFKRFKNSWILIEDALAQVGSGGVQDKIYEGENATPRGLFGLKIAFGHEETPHSVLPYYRLKEGDMWVTDPQSRYYNLFVRKDTVLPDWGSAIDLYAAPLRYATTIVIDYNITRKEAYKGSAIFIQCSIGKTTHGSIAIPSELMEKLIRFVDQDTKILIN